MKLLNQLSEKIDALSLRERCMVLSGFLLILFFIWDAFMIRPLQLKQNRIKTEIQQKNTDVVIATMELQGLIQKGKSDPNAANRKKLAELKKTMSVLEEKLQQITSHMVAPEKMAKVLETVLNKTSGLKLLQLKGLGSSPLVVDEKESEKQNIVEIEVKPDEPAMVDTAFKHGFQISFSGDYFGTLRYLEKIERLDWKFYWDSIEYKVGEYPIAVSTISVYTVSLNPNWIGI